MTRQRGSSITRVETGSGPRWRFRLDLPPTDDGKRRQVTRTYKSEREAVDAQTKARAQLGEGTFVEPDRATVNDMLDRWIQARAVRWKPSTRYQNVSALKPIRAAIGTRLVQKLRPEDIDGLVATLGGSGGRGGAGRSARSIHLQVQLLSAALDLAVRRGTVMRNVAAGIDLPTVRTSERHVWTAPQLRTFIDAAMEDRLAGAFALSTLGMRRGEVLGTRWGDVDWDRRVVTVRQARVQVGAEVIAGSPKSDRGRRDVPLHPAVIDALRVTRERTYEAVPIDIDKRLIAVDEMGEPVRPDHYSRRFHEVAASVGLPTIRLHDVRHSVATLLLEAGQPPHVVAAILGHDVRTLLATYAHSNATSAALAMDALASALSPALGSVSDRYGAPRDIESAPSARQISV